MIKLEAGAVDLVSVGLPISDFLRLQSDPRFQVLLNDRTGSSWVAYLNCTRAPTNDKLVRQALNYALDRQRMADLLWNGRRAPIELLWSTTSPAYDAAANTTYTFDLDRARALLAQTTVTNMHLEIIWASTAPDLAKIAQIYQSDLVKLGFDVILKQLEAPVYLATRNNLDYQGIQLAGHTLGHLLPASNTLGASYGPERNLAGFTDDAYTQLVNLVVTETDPAKQRLLHKQLNDFYLDQSWVLPIVQNPERVAASRKVHGLRYDAHQALVAAEIWLSS